MKLNNNKAWDNLIYNIVYPGFFGSMLYDLATVNGGTAHFIFKCLVVLFFAADYLHLYNDMHNVVPVYKREGPYFWCDIIVSVLFFFAFFFVAKYCFTSFIAVSLVPFVIMLYKWKNKPDRNFFLCYSISAFFLSSVYVYIVWYKKTGWRQSFDIYANTILFLEIAVYAYYIFNYYNKYSYGENKRIYQWSKD